MPRTFLAIPAYGSPELTDAVLRDLARDEPLPRDDLHVVVVDNAGDYVLPGWAAGVELVRTGENLRWIGTANWAFERARQDGAEAVVLLNNDTRLSRGFVPALVGALAGEGVAVAAACYDDFWLHQRAVHVPAYAEAYEPRPVVRDVPFCDGTAIAFSLKAVAEVGPLDTATFPHHGYGADVDWALRARAAGWRVVVTEAAYVHHLRRVTMTRIGRKAEDNRAEILTGLDARWGDRWRTLAGLGPGAFPPHNTGSGLDWYADRAWVLGLLGEPDAR
ncbi:glycosyltransferase family 2 protein [Microlunatus flavus]|uniref:Glycosyltransferase, GT2 family n=1 Tax=Microlunatus flavus TaxID=1036181 RepID=A0A1H9I096_9ACTN|nr:glycosyltransferase [Microlunatus flavus]SEQ68050.1 Glycosyltransferase, GT2 family [Microlunatus flavus]